VVSQQVLAEQYGLSTAVGGKVVCNESNVQTLLDQHPSFETLWLNTDTDTYYYGDSVVEWDITDHDLCRYMQHYFQLHTLQKSRVADCMRGIAAAGRRSPFKDWVDGQVWDVEDWPIRLWGCEDGVVTREVALKFMVGMYARLMVPGCKMDWMMVTVGGQGIGKSWWADLVSRGQSVTFMASGNARDDASKMHKGLVVVVDEMDAFNKREMTYWKTMISNPVDTYRPAYGRGEVTMPRSSVLYGTSNHSTFLRHDSSGQRRFGVLEPKRMLDVPGLREVLGQLWAEAAARYNEGVRYWELSEVVQAKTRESYQAEDPIQAQVEEFLAGLLPYSGLDTGERRFRMLDLLRWLNMEDKVQARSLTGQLKEMLVCSGCTYKNKLRIGKTVSAGYVYIPKVEE
jgi:predicted P-loop ATPase